MDNGQRTMEKWSIDKGQRTMDKGKETNDKG